MIDRYPDKWPLWGIQLRYRESQMHRSLPAISRWFEPYRILVRGCDRIVGTSVLVSLFLALSPAKHVSAATATNAQSPVGMNLWNVRYSAEQPFIDIFKTS